MEDLNVTIEKHRVVDYPLLVVLNTNSFLSSTHDSFSKTKHQINIPTSPKDKRTGKKKRNEQQFPKRTHSAIQSDCLCQKRKEKYPLPIDLFSQNVEKKAEREREVKRREKSRGHSALCVFKKKNFFFSFNDKRSQRASIY